MSHTSAHRSLTLGLLLMTSTASAAEPKDASWAELQSVPARLPAAQPKPAEPAPCQPENFIPGETPVQRVKREGTPSELYALSTGEQMNINGWLKENERVVKLPSPYTLTYYTFGCASDFSDVLDVSRNGKRHGLYQHVIGFEAHPSKPVLFFDQNERKNGRYQKFIGLVDIDTKRKTPLPELPCVSGTNARFSGDRLITYGEAHAGKDGRTDVCVWSLDGKLKAQLLADLDWTAGAKDTLLDQVGVLPREPGTFYSLHHDRFTEPAHCELRLQSLTRANQSRRIDLGVSDSPEACLSNTAKLDTASLTGR
ncbi:hypothetical protein [Vitiosangium sp. GDMCC 1.1324]|uniref:hypothetical protein n=1 Tax=Vitiosangium sp. (strain GDMCC 1.1324) TaxID=2138576 RepID=UPI000D36316C|nr:hypothetical protein [Vitiosangium sp. GDMCC 1.1324]PTL76448.1 hypothetical protein DAT35_49880 [Vitiosangium sp. GDMCC 1.1324]